MKTIIGNGVPTPDTTAVTADLPLDGQLYYDIRNNEMYEYSSKKGWVASFAQGNPSLGTPPVPDEKVVGDNNIMAEKTSTKVDERLTPKPVTTVAKKKAKKTTSTK